MLFPKFIFDEYLCKKLIDSVFNYRKEFDKKLGVYKDRPLHDESSHFVDPLRCLAMMIREQMKKDENDGLEDVEEGSQGSCVF
jgi:hypothetical protein